MCDTPSHGNGRLWLIWKESIQNCRCYRADTAGGTDRRTEGRTDGRTEWNQYTPQQLRCSGGIMKPIYPPTTSLFGGYKDGWTARQMIGQMDRCRWQYQLLGQRIRGLKSMDYIYILGSYFISYMDAVKTALLERCSNHALPGAILLLNGERQSHTSE